MKKMNRIRTLRTLVINAFIFLVIFSLLLHLTGYFLNANISLLISLFLAIVIKQFIHFESN